MQATNTQQLVKGRPKKGDYTCGKCFSKWPNAQSRINHERCCKGHHAVANLLSNTSSSMPPPLNRTMAPSQHGLDYSQFTVVKVVSQELGFHGSDVDGEAAHRAVKEKVESTFGKYNNVPAELPSVTTSNQKTSVGKTSASTALEDQKRALQKTEQWNSARDVIQQ